MDEPTASRSQVVSTSRRAFEPARWLGGGHRQTVLPALLPAAAVPGATVRIVEVERGTSVEAHVNRAADRGASRGTLLGGVTVPSLILASADDPVVPRGSFARYETAAGHPVRFEYTASGGHVGVLAPQ